MSLYRLELRAHGPNARKSQFRAWIDPVVDALDTEIDVQLQRLDDDCWSGTFLLGSAGFYYRIGITGQRGSWWSVSLRDASQGLELVHDADRLWEPKAWILGSWGLRGAIIQAGDERAASR